MSINAECVQALSTRITSGMVEITSTGGVADCGDIGKTVGKLGTMLGPEK